MTSETTHRIISDSLMAFIDASPPIAALSLCMMKHFSLFLEVIYGAQRQPGLDKYNRQGLDALATLSLEIVRSLEASGRLIEQVSQKIKADLNA